MAADSLVQNIKKSELRAETAYDYKKMTYENDRLLACSIEEQAESLKITYDIQNYRHFPDIRKCSKQERLRMLIDAGRLISMREEYSFVLTPDNLYYDENARVYIKSRDVYRRGEIREEHFTEEYKALIGYAMQNRYSYEDYLEGGNDLFAKNIFLKKIAPLENVEAIMDLLEDEYQELSEDIRIKKLVVNKKGYILSRIYIVLSILLIIAGASEIVLESFINRPVLEAKLQAEIDFVRGDYVRLISDLSELSMQQLSYDQKYILSVAYVSMENLTAEQKQNILEKLPINGDEKLMEYWIYIGRLEPLEAENIALQRSDDELLLYAYMLDKNLTESDTQMQGTEKAAKLAELEGKIAGIAKKYETEE